MEGSHPAVPAEPGTLKTSLIAMPGTDSADVADARSKGFLSVDLKFYLKSRNRNIFRSKCKYQRLLNFSLIELSNIC